MERIRPIPDIEYEVALLKYIQVKGEIRPFLKATGIDLKRLSQTVDRLLDEGYLKKEGKKLSLTERGKTRHSALNMQLSRKGIYAHLLPDYSVRREAMDPKDLYIPKYMFKKGGGHFSNSYVLGRSDESSGDNELPYKHDK